MPLVEREVLHCEQCGASLESAAAAFGCLNCLLVGGFTEPETESRRFQHYEVCLCDDGVTLDKLGYGAMGITYRALDVNLDSPVALKVISTRYSGNPEARERFRREARAAAQLRHPNVASVFHFGETPLGQCFYAMELVEGETLEARVRREGPLPGEVALDVATQVTRALMAAATHGLVHRDLKPSNLMVVANDSGSTDAFVVKVIDFGLAKAIVEAPNTSDQTHASFSGTPEFASPEQFNAGKVPLDARSDIYSLGATLWYLLCGRAPFASRSPAEPPDQPLPLEQLAAAKVPAPMVGVLRSMLATNPAERPQSARELLDALRRCHEAMEAAPRRRKRLTLAALALGLLAIIAVGLTNYFSRQQQPAVPEKSIAVLPFLDLSQAKDQEYFCDGISEEILDALAKVDGLRVVAHTSSFSFKGKNADLGEVGRKLNVENVLKGSLRRDGKRIRITAQLINMRNGFQLWSETYERELQGIFALQDEITRAIVDALKIKLAISLPAREQPNSEAYDLYPQGLYFSNKGSEEDLRRALSFFERALQKDPTFGRARTGIAKVWFFLADVYVKPLKAYSASRAAALKAIALDGKDAEAHCYLGEAKRILDWDLPGEEVELQRALQLDPNSAPVHFFLALLPLFRGDVKEGLRLVLEAEKLDPLSPIIGYVATAAYLADNRIDEAIIEGQRTQQLDPHYFYLDSNLAAAYREKGNFAEAIALYTKAQGERRFPSSGLAITYARMGQQIEARKILDQLLQERQTRYVSAQTIAAIYVAFGEKEEAFRWLDVAAAEHSGTLQWIAFLPDFAALRPDARFPQFLRRIGVAHGSVLAITETTLVETKDPNAEARFTLKVGVKPRPNTPNGHVVRLSVSFYDRTKDNKMKLTDARVGYDWITATRDWTDATPKFLGATYVRPKTQAPSPDGRQYGGFIVRVYFDGQLQDVRATPPELLTLFPAPDQLAPPPNAGPSPSN
jgi:serine/threonine-protein kinase